MFVSDSYVISTYHMLPYFTQSAHFSVLKQTTNKPTNKWTNGVITLPFVVAPLHRKGFKLRAYSREIETDKLGYQVIPRPLLCKYNTRH